MSVCSKSFKYAEDLKAFPLLGKWQKSFRKQTGDRFPSIKVKIIWMGKFLVFFCQSLPVTDLRKEFADRLGSWIGRLVDFRWLTDQLLGDVS